MKLHSVYLNPFQPFPERELDNEGEEGPRNAIEDNMSRSVFSALANTNRTSVLATFLQALASHGSTALRDRTEALAKTLRDTDPSKVECGLQTWPIAAMQERERLQVLLIGISSSHDHPWTFNQRCAPEDPRPDAWIYVPGKMLLVFECKNDEHALDATQVSAYAHRLGLLAEADDVPCAEVNKTLASPAEAEAVQNACAALVIDAPWSAVADVLGDIQREDCVGDLGRWLCGQAATYIEWHIRPPYRGVTTILEWLKGPDTEDRRTHLRTLVRRMGDELAESANGSQGAITFAKGKGSGWDLLPGAGSAVRVELERHGQTLQIDWLGRKVAPVLWFQFAEDESQRIGLEYYIQASGSDANGKGDDVSWNNASDRHRGCAIQFEKLLSPWISHAPLTSLMIVSSVRFKGKKRFWQGGGIEDAKGPTSPQITPNEAMAFLQKHREELWRFPRVGLGEGEAPTVAEAALLVRKPALSLLFPLETSRFAACGGDRRPLQDFLQNAVAGITTKAAHEPHQIEGEQAGEIVDILDRRG